MSASSTGGPGGLWLAATVFASDRDGVLVTVLVVTYNGARRLDRCLDAVAAQDLVGQGQVACWVVDNASGDGSDAVVLGRTDGVRLIRSTRNLGFAGGNNLALRQARSPYVVLLNDDAVVQPGWLHALLEPFENASVGAVAGKLLLEPRFVSVPLRAQGVDRLGLVSVARDGEDVTAELVWDPLLVAAPADGVRWCRPSIELLVPLRTDAARLEHPVCVEVQVRAPRAATLHVADRQHAVPPNGARVVLELPAGTPTTDVVNSAGTVLTLDGYAADRGFGRADDTGYDMPAEVFGGCGASLALRTAALGQVGIFDDAWFLYYEDVDLCWRLRRAGWTVRYQPRAVARHEHSATVGSGSVLHVFHDARNRLLTLTKNASFPLVRRSVGRYLLSTAAAAVRAVPPGAGGRSEARLRLQVVASFLRLLPGVLVRRRAVQRSAVVARTTVEAWLGADIGGGRDPGPRSGPWEPAGRRPGA